MNKLYFIGSTSLGNTRRHIIPKVVDELSVME
jgi:hypothetical protein